MPSPTSPARSKVVMYSARWCAACKQARAFFLARGIRFQEFDIESSARGRRDFQRLGGRGVPIILIGDQRLDGFSVRGFLSLYGPHSGRR